MDATTPTSCIICYEADELGSMVQVEFASRDNLRVTRVVLCRRCAGAISDELTAVMADEDQIQHDRNFDRAVVNGGAHRPVDDWGAGDSGRVAEPANPGSAEDRDAEVDKD
jgi:hypothetical protein